MAAIYQCLLRQNNTYTVRWVSIKKAKEGIIVTAKSMKDETTEETWEIDTVFSGIEREDKYHFHVVE